MGLQEGCIEVESGVIEGLDYVLNLSIYLSPPLNPHP